RQKPGVADIIAVFDGAIGDLATASWLTASNHALDGRRPIDLLASGDTGPVLAVAHRFAARMRHSPASGAAHRTARPRPPEPPARARAQMTAPPGAPLAAQLTSPRARSLGVTQALWAGQDRPLTQRWAVALRRAGWLALWHGTQHDPTSTARSITLFDTAGE